MKFVFIYSYYCNIKFLSIICYGSLLFTIIKDVIWSNAQEQRHIFSWKEGLFIECHTLQMFSMLNLSIYLKNCWDIFFLCPFQKKNCWELLYDIQNCLKQFLRAQWEGETETLCMCIWTAFETLPLDTKMNPERWAHKRKTIIFLDNFRCFRSQIMSSLTKLSWKVLVQEGT